MIKRTLYFGNPAYLSLRNAQLVIRLPEIEKSDVLSATFKKEAQASIPIEDIGVVIIDHPQITITQGIIDALLENNAALITCNQKHLPTGLLLNLDGNTLQSERFRKQCEASLPLKKQLWQQTVECKIYNQKQVLKKHQLEFSLLENLGKKVRSGDEDNCEATAAAFYWKKLSQKLLLNEDFEADITESVHITETFIRHREGEGANLLLNYGYAILRAIVARNLVGSGLLPTFGIHHRNKYNAYCLADDIMEPYRPYVDALVIDMIAEFNYFSEMNTELKRRLLQIPVIDVFIDGEKSPLMIAVQRTTASLAKCFEGKEKKIVYPKLL